MKSKHILAFTLTLLLTIAIAKEYTNATPRPEQNEGQNGFVVLELFTSEGCSSCPHADELLAKVQQQAGNKPIYILAYHIDYWDHQGWRDIFSSPESTQRQYWYANKLNAQVYTPQVVVNGSAEFVGSNEAALTHALRTGLPSKSTNALHLTGKRQDGKLTVNYETSTSRENLEIVIATIQKNAERQIKRGENTGRTLRHVQIVRKFETFKPNQTRSGQISISLPREFNDSEWEVIGFLQDKKTGEILGVRRC